MNISKLVRNREMVINSLVEKDNNLVCKKLTRVYVPQHYMSGKLGEIETNVRTIGVFGIVVEDKYLAVNMCCAMMVLAPDSTSVVTVDEEPYLELTFEPGSILVLGLDLVKTGSLIFNIYDELIAKGKTPWYIGYNDLGALFDSAIHHAGVNLKAARSVLEMMTASRGRDPKDLSKYYRNTLTKQSDLESKKPRIIPLRSIMYGSTNAVSKLLGSYAGEGLSSSLVNPSTRLEKVEEILLS